MTRINLFRTTANSNTPFRSTPATSDSVAWGKSNFDKNTSTFVFAALLMFCSITVGCSSDKPKEENSTSAIATIQPIPPVTASPVTAPAAPTLQAAAKPVHKKVVRKAPVTTTYVDKLSGVSFQYPRKYVLKTGEAADELLSSDLVPTNFVQPGGASIAAVTIPESAYPKSDLAAALFNVSVNKALTAEQCGQFSEAKATGLVDPGAPVTAQASKLTIGEMELQSSESLASQGTRKEASKYYHVFENGACYEFALKVATETEPDEGGKHVDRDEIFQRLEKILATVKISPATAPEVTASSPVTPAPATALETPAQ
jgi:hypothetical protein